MDGGRTSLDELRALAELAETPEDLAYIEKELIALETADRETARQKATLDVLTQQTAAWLIGVSTKHLRDQGVARNADGTYNGPDLVMWFVDRVVAKAKEEWERDSDVVKSAVERQAEARAVKLEAEARGLQDKYVLREEVEQELASKFARMRSIWESLPKEVSPVFTGDAKELQLKEITNAVRQRLKQSSHILEE